VDSPPALRHTGAVNAQSSGVPALSKRKALAQVAPSGERDRVDRIVAAARETKAEDVILFDMLQRSSITDWVLVCSGRSQAHVRGIAERIETAMRQVGTRCLSSEGYQEGSWVLLDFDIVIVHVFHPETRAYYDLESLLAPYPCERFPNADSGPEA